MNRNLNGKNFVFDFFSSKGLRPSRRPSVFATPFLGRKSIPTLGDFVVQIHDRNKNPQNLANKRKKKVVLYLIEWKIKNSGLNDHQRVFWSVHLTTWVSVVSLVQTPLLARQSICFLGREKIICKRGRF